MLKCAGMVGGKDLMLMANTRKIGRHAGSGKFIKVKEAKANKKTAVVETVRNRTKKK